MSFSGPARDENGHAYRRRRNDAALLRYGRLALAAMAVISLVLLVLNAFGWKRYDPEVEIHRHDVDMRTTIHGLSDRVTVVENALRKFNRQQLFTNYLQCTQDAARNAAARAQCSNIIQEWVNSPDVVP